MKREARKTHYSLADIEFELERKRVKNLNLRVRADGSVHVSAPARVSLQQVFTFVESRVPWIHARQAELARRQQAQPQAWTSGEQLMVWGEPLAIELQQAPGPRRESVAREGATLQLSVSDQWLGDDETSIAHRQALVDTWLRTQLEQAALPLLRHHEQRMGVHATVVRFRRMKTRWGSCNVKTGAVTFNTELYHLPLQCLESVVVHELCHLLEPSHNERFHALMDRYYPGWKAARKLLNALPPTA